MAGTELAGQVSHRARRTSCPAVGERRFTVAALDLGIKANTPADAGRARHRGARAAGPVQPRGGAGGRRRTASSTPTGPATPRPPPTRSSCSGRCWQQGIPYFGICFGNQLFGRALGFGTYKLKYGHRGHQPAGDGPDDRQGRGHRAQPRLRGRRPARRAPPRRRTARRPSATSASTTTWSRGSSCATTGAGSPRSRCSTTPRRPRGRTTRRTSSTASTSCWSRPRPPVTARPTGAS